MLWRLKPSLEQRQGGWKVGSSHQEKLSCSQQSVMLFYWKSIKPRHQSYKEGSDLIGCQCSKWYADDQSEYVLLVNAG